MRTGKTGFTLIELLVVIAIIAILAAILFPVFARAKQAGHRARCSSNYKQLVTAVINYVDDNGGRFPCASYGKFVDMAEHHMPNTSCTSNYLMDVLMPYVKDNKQVWLCPALRPNDHLPDEFYKKLTWADNGGRYGGKYNEVASNIMWNSARYSPKTGKIIPVSGSMASEVKQPSQALMLVELPYWGEKAPHLAGSNNLMGTHIAFFDGHTKLIIHSNANAYWAYNSGQGWE